MSRLSETAMLVNLHIAVWNAEREDKRAGDAVAAKYGNDGKYGKYRKFLIDPDALKPIVKIRTEARNRHYDLTLPWDDAGGRIITATGFMAYRDDMRDFGQRLDYAANDFANDYVSLVQDAQRSLNGLWNPAEYPNQEAIRGKFSFKTRILPVSEASDFRADVGEEERRVIQEQIRGDVRDQLAYAMGDVARRVREVVEHMSQGLKRFDPNTSKLNRKGDAVVGPGNSFRDSLVENIRSLVDLLPSLNITGDSRITELTWELRDKLLRTDAEGLRVSDSTRNETAMSADAILRKMSAMGL